MKLHHLGIAVESLKEAVPRFEQILGRGPVSRELVEEQKVRVVVFEAGESRIELLEATAADSPIARFINKRGPGLHHMALAVTDLERALEALERSGVQLVDRKPRAGASNQRIAFIHPKSSAGVLIELVEDDGS